MPNPFLSSEEYDDRAHSLYNEGRYDEALDLLREGLTLYPDAVELHVGAGYARLAREEYAWARRAFEDALILDPEHEDALAGAGELHLKFGNPDMAMQVFDRTIALGYDDDTDLMLQIGRALFREGYVEQALSFFERAVSNSPDSAEALACMGYAQHRIGKDYEAISTLRSALRFDPGFGEARVYLANLLYDSGELEEARAEFQLTRPEDHWDELGIWRMLQLRKSNEDVPEDSSALLVWEARLAEISPSPDPIDELLAEVETRFIESIHSASSNDETREQLEMLGSLLGGLNKDIEKDTKADDALAMEVSSRPTAPSSAKELAAESDHLIILSDGREFEGTWLEIVYALRDSQHDTRSLDEFMASEARRYYGATGVRISSTDPEEFLRGSEHAGLLRIIK